MACRGVPFHNAGLVGLREEGARRIESNARVGFVGAGSRHGARWASKLRHCGFWIQFAAGRRRRRQLRNGADALRMRQKLLRRPTLFSSTRYPMARFNCLEEPCGVVVRRGARCAVRENRMPLSGASRQRVLAADAEEYGAKAASVHPLFAIFGGKRSGENRL